MQKKGTDSPKPFTNFSLFNESLISRLKQVAQLKTLFEKSTKEIEARFNENFTSVASLFSSHHSPCRID